MNSIQYFHLLNFHTFLHSSPDPRPVGRCPSLLPGVFGTCVEACGLDGGCKPGFLCCSNGCGHTCQRAVIGESSVCKVSATHGGNRSQCVLGCFILDGHVKQNRFQSSYLHILFFDFASKIAALSTN